MSGKNIPLLGRSEIQEKEAEISTITGLLERADNQTVLLIKLFIKTNLTNLFKRNKGNSATKNIMYTLSTDYFHR